MTSLNDLDLRQLEAFATVISAGSVTAAARVLGRSQPAVTRLIQDLEASLGYPLFVRNGPRIHPTEQALKLHQYVEKALLSLEQIRLRAQEIGQAGEKPLMIAATPAMSSGLLPGALAQMALTAGVQILSDSAEQTAHAVITGEADLAISSLPLEHHAVSLHWIGQARCVLALPEADPLAAKAVISLGDLASRPLIAPHNPWRLRRRFDKALAKHRTRPKTIVETNSSANILACVRAGLGIAILEPVTAYGLPVQGVAIRELEIDIPYYFGVVTPLGRAPNERVLALVDALGNVAAAMLPMFQRLAPGEHQRVMQLLNKEKAL